MRTLRLRRGTTEQMESFTGHDGELTWDTEKKCPVLHDGETPGGFPLDVQLIKRIQEFLDRGEA